MNDKKKILILDDDPNIRMLLEFVLRKRYSIITEKDGLEGMLWLAQGNLPDLIIADIEMPRMDGFEFLTHVRESGFFRDIPVIILSGHESNGLRLKSAQHGANEYLIKPFNPEVLLQKIEKILVNRLEREVA